MGLFRKAIMFSAAAGLAKLVMHEKQCYDNRCNLRKDDKKIDNSMEDTFPASDPPSWNAGHAVGAPDAA